MSKTIGPVLAIGTMTIINGSIFHNRPMDWRVPIATGLAAVGFSLAERVWEQGAVILAWTAFLTVLLARTDPNTPSPIESAISWFNNGNSGNSGKGMNA
jgi:hypothetical protein